MQFKCKLIRFEYLELPVQQLVVRPKKDTVVLVQLLESLFLVEAIPVRRGRPFERRTELRVSLPRLQRQTHNRYHLARRQTGNFFVSCPDRGKRRVDQSFLALISPRDSPVAERE